MGQRYKALGKKLTNTFYAEVFCSCLMFPGLAAPQGARGKILNERISPLCECVSVGLACKSVRARRWRADVAVAEHQKTSRPF